MLSTSACQFKTTFWDLEEQSIKELHNQTIMHDQADADTVGLVQRIPKLRIIAFIRLGIAYTTIVPDTTMSTWKWLYWYHTTKPRDLLRRNRTCHV